jgi:hypothetical protein
MFEIGNLNTNLIGIVTASDWTFNIPTNTFEAIPYGFSVNSVRRSS